MQPKVHIRYSQDKPSFVSAIFYLESARDVFGWYVHATDKRFSAGFFMIENFYTRSATVLYRSVDNDLYGDWTMDHPPTRQHCRCPVPDSMGHELERIQSLLVDEWLFFHDDPNVLAELTAYREHGLATHAVNVRCKKLTRLDRAKSEWSHRTPGIDLNVADFLEKHWRVTGKSVIDVGK